MYLSHLTIAHFVVYAVLGVHEHALKERERAVERLHPTHGQSGVRRSQLVVVVHVAHATRLVRPTSQS